MGEYVLGDRSGRLSKHIAEYIVKFQVGYGQAILCTVLLASQHVGEFEPVPNQIPKMTNFGGRDKGRLDHVTHEQIADPLCVLTVGLISLLRFGVLGVSKYDIACFLKDIEYRDPVFACRLHTHVGTVVRGKPCGQIPQTSGERGESLFFVLCPAVGIGESDTGKDPGFVDIKTTTIETKDFKTQ